MLLERADAALAQRDVRIAGVEDVFRRQQQLLQRGRRAAFQQHRGPLRPHGFQEAEVLHVPRADLQHVGIAGNQGHVAGGNHLGHKRQAGSCRAAARIFRPSSFSP